MDKPLYKSKRFGSTVFTAVLAILLVLVSNVKGIDADQRSSLLNMVPDLFKMLALLVIGFSLTDWAKIKTDASMLAAILDQLLDMLENSSDADVVATARSIRLYPVPKPPPPPHKPLPEPTFPDRPPRGSDTIP